MKNMFMLLTIALIFVSCSKGGDDRLAKQESIRSTEQLNAQNQNQREWAKKMEKDLNKRKFFIEAIEGTYLGDLTVDGIDFVIKAEISSSIPISFSDRTRTLDEINYELENLAINLHVKLENPRVSNSAVSCTIEGYKPDIEKGLIKIISESCKNIFKFMVSDDLSLVDRDTILSRARSLARSASLNEITQIDILSGIFESSISTKEYQFKMKRQ
ncbi:MAG: hypothetical protein N4A33_02875 [Bacteriovoracaceae bacterium]|nr:hypothetical protein [Bacteriovoracaceae bacterium]